MKRDPSRRAQLLIVATLLLVAFVARTWGISQDFWLMGDQIRDWDLVQGSFASLPVTGTPRSGGGYHLGPAYYWFLWASRSALAPWVGNLPHVGGIAVTAVELASFGALAVAGGRLGLPFPAVAGMTVLLASNPYGAALARAGWNPSLALAFANLALALYLARRDAWTVGHQVVLAALCWIALQMHVAAFPLALCLITLGACLRPASRSTGVGPRIAGTALAIGILQLPFTIAQERAGGGAAGGSIASSLARLVHEPGSALVLRGCAFVLGDGARQLFLAAPLSSRAAAWLLGVLIVAGAWAVLVRRRDAALGIAVYLPLALAAAAFTVLDRTLEAYWLLPLLGVYGLVAALPLLLPSRRVTRALALAFLAATIALLPARWTWFRLDHRYGRYGTVTRAAASLVRDRVAVRALIGPLDGVRPTSSSPLVRWLGGTLSADSPLVARVSPAGQLTVRPEPLEPAR